MKRLKSDQRGAAALEFALVLPVLLVLVFGVFEFGLLWNASQVITDAAREGARRAVVANPAYAASPEAVFETVETAVRRARPNLEVMLKNANYCAPELPGTPLQSDGLEIYGCQWDAGSGMPARVAVRYGYEFSLLAPLLQWSTGQRNVVLRTDFWMRNE
jgi:hypothetical protein